MGGCAAANCSNHSRNGFRMVRFPTRKEIQIKWAINCRRKDWEPGPQAQICIAHFEPNQFEKNIPGKLKRNAIPTLFSRNPKPKHRKSPKKRRPDDLQHYEKRQQPSKIARSDHSYWRQSSVPATKESGHEDLFTPTNVKMFRNVEIKAKIKDFRTFLETAQKITDKPEVVLEQEDTYFRVPEGRLKLRQVHGSHSQFYKRPDTAGPKLSNFDIQEFRNNEEANGLKEVLKSSLGIMGIVKKQRHLFMVGQTRIHVDNVTEIGHFMELEVVLEKNQSLEYGQSVANELMSKLNVSLDDLLQGSYIDMLLQNQ